MLSSLWNTENQTQIVLVEVYWTCSVVWVMINIQPWLRTVRPREGWSADFLGQQHRKLGYHLSGVSEKNFCVSTVN